MCTSAPAAADSRATTDGVEADLCQSAGCRRSDNRGRVLVMEVLIPTPAISQLIREDKYSPDYRAMQTGTGQTAADITTGPGKRRICQKHGTWICGVRGRSNTRTSCRT